MDMTASYRCDVVAHSVKEAVCQALWAEATKTDPNLLRIQNVSEQMCRLPLLKIYCGPAEFFRIDLTSLRDRQNRLVARDSSMVKSKMLADVARVGQPIFLCQTHRQTVGAFQHGASRGAAW